MLSPRASRWLQLVSLSGFVLGATFAYLSFNFLLFFVLFAAYAANALLALALVLDAAVSRLRGRPTPHLETAWIPLAFLLAAGSFGQLRAPFAWVGAALRFSVNASEYEAAVSRVQAGAASDDAIYWTCQDTGRPLHAFLWDGMADNWCGIIHDQAEQLDYSRRGAFGNGMIYRIRLWGPWYYAEFS
jgi:hypothetical protein